jgi:SSS family solute:Na+ symporter
VAISYLFAGGFRSDVHTDVVEFIMMFAGFAVILPYCFSRYGGLSFLRANLPPLHLTWHGGNSIQYILVWFFIALWTLVDPAFHQRCYAAKSGEVAQRGILVSIAFWFLFDFMTATAGLYARAALPNLAQPMTSYPMLAEAVLPPVAKGMFFVGMLASIMSSVNTLAFVSAQTLGRDIWLRFRPGSAAPAAATRIGLVLTFFLSVLIALVIPSVITIWYTIGTVIIPGLLVPLVSGYFDSLRIPSRYAFLAMLLGWLTSLVWMAAGFHDWTTWTYPLAIEPMYPGLAVSMALWAIGRSRR